MSSDLLGYVFIGVDSLLIAGLYYVYKQKRASISNIESAAKLDLSKLKLNELPTATLEYCMIEGNVKADSLELTSQFRPEIKGVVRMLEMVEHGTKWHSNVPFDTNRLITRVINDSPFSIISPLNPKLNIKVEQPLAAAEYLLESMELTYKVFEPAQRSTLARIIADLTFNETVRGVETTEKMLRTGAGVIVFGKLEKLATDNGQIKFRVSKPTLKGDYSYIITTERPEALINRLLENLSFLKITMIVLGIAGCAVATYCSYKSYNRFRHWLHRRRIEREIAKARQERSRTTVRDNEERQNTNCVICMTNPRELILLDCGHVCLCMDCFNQLPNPNCPVCRQAYRDFLPCYLP